MKNKALRTVIYYVIIIGIVSAFSYYLYQNAEKFQKLLYFSPEKISLLFLIAMAFPVINGVQNTFIYRELGINDFSYWDGFLITWASTLANQLPVPGGIMSRGYYLKLKHNLSYTKFTSSTIAIFFCSLAISGLIGDISLAYWKISTGNSVPIILIIAFTGMLTSLLVFWIPLDKIRLTEKVTLWAHQAMEGWNLIGRNPALLIKLTISQVLLVFLVSVRYYIVFEMLSQNVTFSQTLLFASASILTQLVSIAPGGLGVREAIVSAVATLLGFDTAVSVVAVGIDRMAITVIIVLTGWFSTIILGKQITDTSSRNE